MSLNTIKKLSFMLIIGSFLTIAFNNCEKPKGSEEGASEEYRKLSDDPCEDQLINFYSRSYQPFLVSNCSSCHSVGPGKGQFSHKDTLISFKDFMQIGYSKVSSNAISEGHNPPYSGSQHTQTVNDLKITWIKALSENDLCKGGSGDVQEVLTLKQRSHFALAGKSVPVMNDNEERRIEFDFASELSSLDSSPLPDLQGAKFSVMIRKVLKGTERYYSVHSPRVFGGGVDIQLKGLFTKINNRYISYSTNFIFADAKISKGSLEISGNSLVSTGAVVIAGAVYPDDVISFDFELIAPTIIPPPPPPVILGFSGVRNVLANGTGAVSFTAQLDRASSEVVTFTFTIDSTPICNGGIVNSSTCLPEIHSLLCPNGACPNVNSPKVELARSVVGATFNRFDWDYKLEGTSYSFSPGETSKTVVIKTARDVRYEANRILVIKLEAGVGSISIPETTSMARIAFNKIINPVPAPNQITFSKLMAGGTLYKTCTECHNSVKRDGGYDIQDYELMVSGNKQILVPGADSISYVNGNKVVNPVSLMYRRTLPAFTPESLLMPRLKTLDEDQYNELEDWLTRGALNN